MKPTQTAIFLLLFICLFSCQEVQRKYGSKEKSQLEAFKKKEKFLMDTSIFYPGIGDSTNRPLFTQKINLVAADFEEVLNSGNPSEKAFQEKIGIGLDRFKGLYIDTEDRERIAHYMEELMDIVGLESSGGALNNFVYDSEIPGEL
ncbi:MAG: DUF4844 domain-containing protein [Bacteroidetes bacterium B1(2017)]|nr:MAG: DUF4844 domain-containing protein [Bacteroidetes bacterium B1(2017)]